MVGVGQREASLSCWKGDLDLKFACRNKPSQRFHAFHCLGVSIQQSLLQPLNEHFVEPLLVSSLDLFYILGREQWVNYQSHGPIVPDQTRHPSSGKIQCLCREVPSGTVVRDALLEAWDVEIVHKVIFATSISELKIQALEASSCTRSETKNGTP